MLSVSVNSSNGNAAESVFRNGFGYTNKTLSDWILRGPTSDATYFADYIAIGCQPQWGASGYAVTFPIALNVVYNVLSIPQTTASTSNAYWGRFYITALNKNGFNVSDTGAGSNRWIAIGSAQPQWRNNPGLWAIPFTEFVAGGITMTRTGSQSSGTWYGDSGTISLTGYTASCATNESWVSNISGSAIAVGL